MKYGYCRISSQTQQTLAIQRESLLKAGCEVIREEVERGTSLVKRKQLQTLLEFLRAGDTLVVTRIDRLARSMKDLLDIVHLLKQKKVSLQATEQPIDTSTSTGNMFLSLLGVFAEFETNLRRERQLEGIAKAKAKGVYKGRKQKVGADIVQELKEKGLSTSAIARQLQVSRKTVYNKLQSV